MRYFGSVLHRSDPSVNLGCTAEIMSQWIWEHLSVLLKKLEDVDGEGVLGNANDPDLNKWQKMDGWTLASAVLEISFLHTFDCFSKTTSAII